ncbi:MAG TPA: alkaline phosphatase family protein [Acidimicrobiales bacterium]|nr:alkaline phosphatase family protein [Acidimicrobiales bacterium]
MTAVEAPAPVLPDFGGGCLTGVVPGLLGHIYGGTPPPGWMPAPVRQASQVVLLVLDGLGARQLAARPALAPTLAAGVGGTITSVAPSTTACALTSLATGSPPAVHGVVGYRVAYEGELMNVLAWTVGGVDARVRVPAPAFQPCPTFPGSPVPVPVVTRYDYGPTGFTAAHLGDMELHRWHTPAGLVTGVRALMESGTRFAYAYYEGIDKVAHARGLGAYYDDELAAVDRLVGDVLAVLPPGAVLVVTADHGQVEVGGAVEVLGADLMDAVTMLSGEGRFRWLHVRPGAVEETAAAARAAFGDVAWVRTKAEMVEQGWLGGVPSAAVSARLGDVALLPFTPTAFLDPADTGELRLLARHGSLTPDEMLVPLLSWAPA